MRVVASFRRFFLACVVSVLALSSCNQQTQQVRSHSSSPIAGDDGYSAGTADGTGAPPPVAPVLQNEGGNWGVASPTTTPKAEAVAPRKMERPGLGTEFGESRYSPVRDVPFERSSPNPIFLGSIHYNDAQGADAQRAHLQRRYVPGEPMWRYYTGNRMSQWAGVTIAIVDENGQPLPAYHLPNHILVVGAAGQRYIIQVENRTGQRFELVASVDGQDVIDGRSAQLGKRGYLVDPYQRIRIEGFRTSMSDVATFRFGSVRNSYAARTSEFGDRNVGVIGVALYAERGAPMPYPDLEDEARRREGADPFPGRFAPQPPPPSY